MSDGLWLPSGPITRAFERVAIPPVGQGTTPSGLVPYGVAFTGAFAALADRQAFPLRLDPATGAVLVGLVPVPPTAGMSLRAAITAAAAGVNPIIAAPGVGLRIRIYHYDIIPSGAVTVQLFSAAAAITGVYQFGAGGGIAYDAPGGDFPIELGVNEAFNITLGGAVAIGGLVQYTVAP